MALWFYNASHCFYTMFPTNAARGQLHALYNEACQCSWQHCMCLFRHGFKAAPGALGAAAVNRYGVGGGTVCLRRPPAINGLPVNVLDVLAMACCQARAWLEYSRRRAGRRRSSQWEGPGSRLAHPERCDWPGGIPAAAGPGACLLYTSPSPRD